jgi:hypothetical protein
MPCPKRVCLRVQKQASRGDGKKDTTDADCAEQTSCEKVFRKSFPPLTEKAMVTKRD